MVTTIPLTLANEALQVPAVTATNPAAAALLDWGAVQPLGMVKVVVAWLPELVAVKVQAKSFSLPAATVCVSSVTLKLFAAVTYGPTRGPPSPTGVEPDGWISSGDASAMARARLRRPLPTCVPASGSAVAARRLTTTPFDSCGSLARSRAAAPATRAALADVPETSSTEPPAEVVAMPRPGAARKAAPVFDIALMRSVASVPATPMTPRSPAGKVGVLEPSLPVAATSTAPDAQA